MAKRKKTEIIDGQLSIFDFCIDKSNYVVQSNEVIQGKQSLSLNSAKLLRSAIMQIKPEDNELKPYVVTIPDLAKLLGIPRQDVHRDIDAITDEIIKNPLYIREEVKGRVKWVKCPWVSMCKYDSNDGVFIQLNEQMKPILLNLQSNYTQYTLDSILTMKSVYAIRVFELLQSKIMEKVLPRNGVDVVLTVEEIRIACDCLEKMKNFSAFREKVINRAINEINEKTTYLVSYADIRKGRSITGFLFHVNMWYHK